METDWRNKTIRITFNQVTPTHGLHDFSKWVTVYVWNKNLDSFNSIGKNKQITIGLSLINITKKTVVLILSVPKGLLNKSFIWPRFFDSMKKYKNLPCLFYLPTKIFFHVVSSVGCHQKLDAKKKSDKSIHSVPIEDSGVLFFFHFIVLHFITINWLNLGNSQEVLFCFTEN